MSTRLPVACAACDEHLISLAFDEPDSVPPECVAHAETCARCAAELAALRDTRALTALPLEEPSEELDARILSALDEHLAASVAEPRGPTLTVLPGGASPQQSSPPSAVARRGWRTPLAAAASIAVIAGGVLMLAEGTRLARRGVPEAAQAEKALAPVMAKEEALPPPPPAPVAQLEEEADQGALLQKAAPSATGGGTAPSPGAYGARDEARRKAPMGARKDAGAPSPTANSYAAPADKEVEKSKRAQTKVSRELAQAEKKEAPAVAALEPQAPAPPPAPEPMAGKGTYEEAERPSLDDVADSLSAPPSSPSGLGGFSTRSVPAARAETLATLDHSRLLSQADAAAKQGDHAQAATLYARVAKDDGASPKLVLRALEGQARALLALGRFDEAAAAAHRLSVMAPGGARLKEEIERARLEAADTDAR